MAKKDKVDGTPIEFYIPPSGSGLRGMGPRVPIPINQPNWKYKNYNQTRPTTAEWFFAICFALTMLIIGVLIFFTGNSAPVKWIFSTVLVGSAVAIIYHLLWRERNHNSNDDNDAQEEQLPRKKKKKLPKHRKDYK